MNLDIEKAFESYLRTGSVHRAGKEFGVSGETIRQEFKKHGKKLNRMKWESWESESISRAYKSPQGFDIGVLAKSLGRTHAAIACKADELKLCCRRGKHIRTAKATENCSIAQIEVSSRPEIKAARIMAVKESIKNNGHPRGFLGKHHSDKAKESISKAHKGVSVPIERTIRQMKTRLARFGTLAPIRKGTTWKSGWRVIGGIRKFYRSRWESNYARYLEWQKLNGLIADWKHETETFWFEGILRGCVSYLPDFRIVNKDNSVEFHEVKGWMDANSKTKIKRMAKYHPTVKLRVFDSAWYKSNAPKLSKLIKDWE